MPLFPRAAAWGHRNFFPFFQTFVKIFALILPLEFIRKSVGRRRVQRCVLCTGKSHCSFPVVSASSEPCPGKNECRGCKWPGRHYSKVIFFTRTRSAWHVQHRHFQHQTLIGLDILAAVPSKNLQSFQEKNGCLGVLRPLWARNALVFPGLQVPSMDQRCFRALFCALKPSPNSVELL